jgi:predicted membrane protein
VALTFALMVLLAGAVADRGGTFPLVLLATTAVAVGLLYMMFPHGPQFAFGAATGLAMYACLYVVFGRAAFPQVSEWAQPVGFIIPIAAFILACWIRRPALRAWAQGVHLGDLGHLPRFARWLVAVAAIGVLCLSFPINRMDPAGQSVALIAAMATIGLISALSVGDVVRLLVEIALIFQAVTRRLGHLAVPIAAYSLLWSLLVVVFGSLYRIADELSVVPLFHGSSGNPIRIGFADALHFSVVTLSTVGYGDIQPADDGIRLLASIQMLLAQLLLLFGFVEIMRGSTAGGLSVEALEGVAPGERGGEPVAEEAPASTATEPPAPRRAPARE